LAEELGFDYAFVLDQDSIPFKNAISHLHSLIHQEEMALIGIDVIDDDITPLISSNP
jgi:hypothetical protein